MIRISVFIWILVLALLGVGLFQVKYNVQSKEAELRHIKSQIDSNLATMHVLDAEWSYLNDPLRLADLARRHTDLTPTQAGQIKTFADLPPRPAPAPLAPLLSSTEPQQPQLQPAPATAAAPATTTNAAATPSAAAKVIPVSADIRKPQDKPVTSLVSAKPAATPAAKPVSKQPASASQQPGSDETIDAILADMQRAQGAPGTSPSTPNGTSPAGDQ
ncbi:MAG: hypothetical protein ABWY00_06260 [Dongiaceae bacterium]